MSEHPNEISIVRACTEHRVRLYDKEHFWERASAGELRIDKEVKRMINPWTDHDGNRLIANENLYFLDDRYPPKHRRHIVLHLHCFLTDTNNIGASGKREPKELLIGDIEYRQLEFKMPRCGICEDGDMIPCDQRFMSSKYKPGCP